MSYEQNSIGSIGTIRLEKRKMLGYYAAGHDTSMIPGHKCPTAMHKKTLIQRN